VIVAVSHVGDNHAAPVLEALRRLGREAVLLDVGELPRRARISLDYGGRRRAWTLDGPAGPIRARDVTAIWWRRPLPFVPEPGLHPDHAAFASRQAYEAVAGLATSLDVRWVNEPWRDDAASRKPRQLATAERAGLRVPRTLVTNDPEKARAFLDAAGRRRVVHKALHATPGDWHTTRFVGREDRARLPAIRLAPVILQEYVPGVDVRVTVVGGRLLAAAKDAPPTPPPEDFRLVFDDAKVEACKLPRDVAARLLALVKDLGLAFAAIDLRRRDDGEHVFLESNPSGQWLFVERRTGYPISAAVADLLAGK
jgi:glutathione synthase/RimK-type ligase-like ATP-grasp enzyme